MARLLKTQFGKTIEIESKSLNSGGQGGIHKILTSGYVNYIVKIYHDQGKAKTLEQKILTMVKYSPCKNATQIVRQSLAWAECALYENQQFVGYLMPKVNNAIELTELSTPRSPHHRHGNAWQKFDISNKDSFRTRLIICYNIARAVELLHQSGFYTLVDLKPDNIMVNNQGLITIIDLDSIQMVDNKGVLRFNADVATEDFAPPEFYNRKIVPKTTKIEYSWDAFSFAVICYKVLFAIHPYQASHNKYSTISELIGNGYFAHGSRKSELRVIPHIHSGFLKLPQIIRQLFFQTFEAGHLKPSQRPVLSDWVGSFSSVLFSHSVPKGFGNYSGNYRNFSQSKPKIFNPPQFKADKLFNANDVIIKWVATNAIRCTLNGNNIGLKGNISVPLENKDYSFLVTGKDGSTISKKISIRVPAPKILNFSLNNISNGNGVLSWDVNNATTVFLNNAPVNATGTTSLNLFLPNYTLTAMNKAGQSVQKSIKNPVWGLHKKITIKSPSVKIRQSSPVLTANHQINYSGKLHDKKYAIHSRF